VKGAPEPSRHLFIYRVDHGTTEEDLKSLLQESGYDFQIRDLECISHASAVFKSFKLSVPVSQFENLFNDEIWPDGVRVRQYRPAKANQ
jgi:hypothetical protein